ncbi:MAG: hypothetical protein CM1200mP26_18910 [Acidimicrobiales bacterium]|nr:MAG: hypothetical protein CM1200mP26_18910 [Acidimicrobiales bacterium]
MDYASTWPVWPPRSPGSRSASRPGSPKWRSGWRGHDRRPCQRQPHNRHGYSHAGLAGDESFEDLSADSPAAHAAFNPHPAPPPAARAAGNPPIDLWPTRLSPPGPPERPSAFASGLETTEFGPVSRILGHRRSRCRLQAGQIATRPARSSGSGAPVSPSPSVAPSPVSVAVATRASIGVIGCGARRRPS